MFDFLRNLRDEVIAEVSLMGNCKTDSTGSKESFFSDMKKKMEDADYLRKLDKDYGAVNKMVMDLILSNNLEGMTAESIYEKIGNSFITLDLISETLEAYHLMDFMKSKGYSADEAEVIMTIANVYDSDKNKSADEIARITNHSVESVNAVISLLTEYATRFTKPFTMESATPNSEQKPVAQSPKNNTSSKTNKKTTQAAS